MEFIPREGRGRTLVGRVRSLLLALGRDCFPSGKGPRLSGSGVVLSPGIISPGECAEWVRRTPFFCALFIMA